MKRKLTKKETARVAAKLLTNIYGENVDAVAIIVNAEAKVLEGDDTGAETLAEALANARNFIQELINGLQPKQKDNGKRDKEKHYPRGC
jgi:hypothetical protein